MTFDQIKTFLWVARLSGFDGTVARVMAEAEASEVLHLATHGFFDDRSTAPYSLQTPGELWVISQLSRF